MCKLGITVFITVVGTVLSMFHLMPGIWAFKEQLARQEIHSANVASDNVFRYRADSLYLLVKEWD